MEEFPAIVSSATSSSSPPSASIQLSDENLSPPAPASVSFAQMLKQQAPPMLTRPMNMTKPVINQSTSVDLSKKTKKTKTRGANESDDEPIDEDEAYYSSVPNFRSSFSLEGVFDRLKLGLFIVQHRSEQFSSISFFLCFFSKWRRKSGCISRSKHRKWNRQEEK